MKQNILYLKRALGASVYLLSEFEIGHSHNCENWGCKTNCPWRAGR